LVNFVAWLKTIFSEKNIIKMKKLSLVICVFNEEPNIKPLSEQIIAALKNIDFEAIFVDDGSTDNTREEIIKIDDERFILVELKRNYGQFCSTVICKTIRPMFR
jgi:cellulose synthase/poly-beta-1,6-N-acetylglucosamine synthase-like glycosyltransferase